MVTFDPAGDRYSPDWFWNLFETPGLLKHIQNWWEQERWGKLGVDTCSSHIRGYTAAVPQMHHSTTWLGQPLAHVCSYQHPKVHVRTQKYNFYFFFLQLSTSTKERISLSYFNTLGCASLSAELRIQIKIFHLVPADQSPPGAEPQACWLTDFSNLLILQGL